MRGVRFPRPAPFALALVAALFFHSVRSARGDEVSPPPRSSLLDDLGSLSSLVAQARWDPSRGVYVARLNDGREAQLTLDHDLQATLLRALAQYKAPEA